MPAAGGSSISGRWACTRRRRPDCSSPASSIALSSADIPTLCNAARRSKFHYALVFDATRKTMVSLAAATILIVEDEALIRLDMQAILAAFGVNRGRGGIDCAGSRA